MLLLYCATDQSAAGERSPPALPSQVKGSVLDLSVVIPVCDAGDSLERTLESLAKQVVPAHEVTLAANPMRTPQDAEIEQIACRFPGMTRVVRSTSMLSTVDLWNFGIASSTGDWISLLTRQVTVRPNYVQSLSQAVERSPEASVVRAGWTRERPKGGAAEQHTLLSVRAVTHPAEALYEQRFGPKASSAAAAIRRKTWETMGGLSPEISLLGDWIGDWALWLTAGALGDTVRSPEIVADIHAEPEQTSRAEQVREMYSIYEHVLPRAAVAAHLPDPTWIAAASRKRFRDVAIAASNDLHPNQAGERSEVALALEPWARAVEQEAMLARLRDGEKIRSFALGKKMRPVLRRVIAAVR